MIRALIPAVAFFTGCGLLQADPAPDVRPVLAAKREEITARPSRVLIAVEDALTMNEQAACEIVKEAITSTRADARLTGEIVFTALEHAPAMSAVIVECAMAVAPGAVKEIERAMQRALGGGSGADPMATEGSGEAPVEADATGKEGSGKEPSGKGAVVPAVADEVDFMDGFLPGSVGVGGIYLIVPNRGRGRCLPGDPCCSSDLSTSCLKP